jgi:plasmid stabilization system protein ParE
MTVSWTSKAVDDLARLHDFLAQVNRRAAARVVQALSLVASRLPEQPRIGERLEQYDPREVRRVIVGKYEMRYEVRDSKVFILRIWHAREER